MNAVASVADTAVKEESSIAVGEAPAMTLLGIVEGDVLTYVEDNGSISLRKLVRQLNWPVPFVVMGVGSLIRRGLLRGIQRELDFIVEPRKRLWWMELG